MITGLLDSALDLFSIHSKKYLENFLLPKPSVYHSFLAIIFSIFSFFSDVHSNETISSSIGSTLASGIWLFCHIFTFSIA